MTTMLAVALYDSEIELEHAVKMLQRGGFDMTCVCVVGRDAARTQPLTGLLHSGRRAWFFGKSSALWNTLSAILLVVALVYFPDGEQLVVLGWLAKTIVPNLRGATPLAEALGALGMPLSAALGYERAAAAHRLLLVAHTEPPGIRSLAELLEPAELRTFEPPPENPRSPQ